MTRNERDKLVTEFRRLAQICESDATIWHGGTENERHAAFIRGQASGFSVAAGHLALQPITDAS